MLTKLAHTCYVNRKYAESEKYFKVCNEMLPLITKNPANIFSAKLNLLVLYTHTDLAKAKSFAERLLIDIDEYLPSHQRELYFAVANIYVLNGQYP